MKSRLLYHKFLQEQGFKNIIDPPYTHTKSKMLTFLFISLILLLIFLFNIIKKMAVGVLEESPQPIVSKYLRNSPPEAGNLSGSLDN